MIAPPHVPERVLELFGAEPQFRDALLGDLAEEFALRTGRDGERSARRWYYREAITAVPHLLRSWLRVAPTREFGRLIGIAITSFIGLLIIESAINAVGYTVLTALDISVAPAWTARLAAISLPLAQCTLMLIAAVSGTLGGYFAAALDPRTPPVSAMAFGLILSSVDLTTQLVGGITPMWYRIGSPLLVLLCALAGGVIRISRLPSRN